MRVIWTRPRTPQRAAQRVPGTQLLIALGALYSPGREPTPVTLKLAVASAGTSVPVA
jgi:hypothetical protein